jgi:hypothetical protein
VSAVQPRTRFPPELLQLLEGKLHRRLLDFVGDGAGRCLLAFVNGERFEVPLPLQTDHDWRIVMAPVERGLIGEALRTGKVETWSAADPRGPMFRGDDRTVEEFAVRVDYQGQPVAVLLIDFFEGEENHLRTYKIEDWRRDIEQILGSADEDRQKLVDSFRAIAAEEGDQQSSWLRGDHKMGRNARILSRWDRNRKVSTSEPTRRSMWGGARNRAVREPRRCPLERSLQGL